MKVGDIVVCIDTLESSDNTISLHLGSNLCLTFGKEYKIFFNDGHNYIAVINDNGRPAAYKPERFVTLSEWTDI